MRILSHPVPDGTVQPHTVPYGTGPGFHGTVLSRRDGTEENSAGYLMLYPCTPYKSCIGRTSDFFVKKNEKGKGMKIVISYFPFDDV